jgi:hypothetical protein
MKKDGAQGTNKRRKKAAPPQNKPTVVDPLSIIVPEKARGVGAIIGTPSRVGELKTARSSEDGPRVGTARPVVVRKG